MASQERNGGARDRQASGDGRPGAARRAESRRLSRRGFLGWATTGWIAFTAAIGGCFASFGRFLFPNVLYESPTRFKVGRPQEFAPNSVDTRFKEEHGLWIVRDGGRLYALVAVCTHLGCPPEWVESQGRFQCPCHGSGFLRSGERLDGPAPRALERASVRVDPEDGQLVVDVAVRYREELGQWDDPGAWVAVG